ncbi:MAG: hypothetical protein QOK47_729, partial [Actinomycetota bacterium]|nr:hypothetical protein [Actinomycetota bacterium]
MRTYRVVPVMVVLLLAAVGAVTAAPLRSSGPSSGHLLSASTPRVRLRGRKVSAQPAATSVDDCAFGLSCNAVPLHIDAPDYAAGNRLLKTTVTWDRGSDLDVYLCHTAIVSECRDNLVASAQRTVGASESLKVRNPLPGDYLVVATASSGSSDFNVAASFDEVAPPAQVPNDTNSDNGFEWQARAVSATSDFGEPSIDLDHAGNIYITAPGGAGVQMWRSFDGGNNFDYKEIASDAGGGDSEIEFNLFDIGFVADLEVEDSEVSRSTNHFNTWDQRGVGIEQDRQWFAHECGTTMYLVYHDFVAEAELLNRSDDESGKEWSTDPV